MVERAGAEAKFPFKAHPHMLRHACGYKLANDGHDTRALQAYLGHKNIQHTVRYSELAPTRFKDFWRKWLLPRGDFAMPLQRGEVRGYDFNRMIVEFTMLNQGKVILCSVSTAAMDDLEGRRDVKSGQRVDQFMRLREVIEERASRKFFEEQAQADRPVVLRSNDFVR
jgi:hypothetical protein